jgi:hypothetical protein
VVEISTTALTKSGPLASCGALAYSDDWLNNFVLGN